MSDKALNWEQHGQSIITSIVLLLLVWVGVGVNEGGKHDVVIAVEIKAMKEQISELKDVVNGDVKNFGRIQASRGPRIQANEIDIKEIYKRIHALELKTK